MTNVSIFMASLVKHTPFKASVINLFKRSLQTNNLPKFNRRCTISYLCEEEFIAGECEICDTSQGLIGGGGESGASNILLLHNRTAFHKPTNFAKFV